MSEEIGVCEYVMVPKHLMKLLGQDIYGKPVRSGGESKRT